jgi:hypothetical protein
LSALAVVASNNSSAVSSLVISSFPLFGGSFYQLIETGVSVDFFLF